MFISPVSMESCVSVMCCIHFDTVDVDMYNAYNFVCFVWVVLLVSELFVLVFLFCFGTCISNSPVITHTSEGPGLARHHWLG